jgi:hypothetical protein
MAVMAAIVGIKSTEKYVRENEAVAVDPFGVLGVESHELVEHDVGNRGHAHRGTRVAGVCLEGGIDLQKHTKSAIEPLKRLSAGFNTLLPLLLG